MIMVECAKEGVLNTRDEGFHGVMETFCSVFVPSEGALGVIWIMMNHFRYFSSKNLKTLPRSSFMIVTICCFPFSYVIVNPIY